MPSPSKKPKATDGLNLIFFSIPQEILLQMGTVPVIMAVLAGKAFSETWKTIGEASEEVFRGERLPILEFPDQTKSEPE